MKRRRFKKEVKQVGMIIIIIITIITIGKVIVNKQTEEMVNDYKTCIQEQSNGKGYIIRSQCSMNYKQLDKQADIEYTQKGKDLYLK